LRGWRVNVIVLSSPPCMLRQGCAVLRFYSNRALASRPQLSICHTTVGVWQETPEVWILLVERDRRRFWVKRKGGLVGRQRARQRTALPLPLVAFSGMLCSKGVCNGRIRLGVVQRLSMVAD
jgi:hypothetical protein